MSIWIILCLFFFAVAILLFIYLIMNKNNISKKEKINLEFSIGGNLFSGIIIIILTQLLTPKPGYIKSPDYINQNRPYLDVQLIIEKVTKQDFEIKYILKNTNSLPADSVNISFNYSGLSKVEFAPIIFRVLYKDAPLTYVVPYKFKRDNQEAYKTARLIVSYDAQIDNETKYFKGIFQYTIKEKELKAGQIIAPSNTEQSAGKFTNRERYNFLLSKDPNLDAKKYEGLGIHTKIVISPTTLDREKYILDMGSKGKDRVSLLLDRNDNFIFRIIDSFSEIHELKLYKNLDRFDYFNPIFLSCDYGIKDGSSFMQILLNDYGVARLEENKIIKIKSIDAMQSNYTLGADISHKNGAVFSSGMIMIMANTTTYKFRQDYGKYFDKSVDDLLKFSGNQFLYKDNHLDMVQPVVQQMPTKSGEKISKLYNLMGK
ncbi:MAG: hypothetical protein P4L35_03085 [Ignavibacteriaceae bacterium]|nr:hypothetical protein [Ignavibacteriaceae bacterium]